MNAGPVGESGGTAAFSHRARIGSDHAAIEGVGAFGGFEK